jgi:oligoribonuclease
MSNPESAPTTPTHTSPAFVWVDLETTDFFNARSRVIQVGFILTDMDLNEIASASWVTYAGPLHWDPVADEMHRPAQDGGTGLKAAAYEAPLSFAQMGPTLTNWLRSHGVDGVTCRPRAAGNGQHFDRDFFLRDLPEVWALFHYRMRDVSCLLEFFAEAGLSLKRGERPHEALSDLRIAITHHKALMAAAKLMVAVSPGGIVVGGEVEGS